MKTLMTTIGMVACLATAAHAQGRGGRQGGPGGGANMGPQCLNPADVQSLETRTTRRDDNSPPTNVVTITGNPGVGRVLGPCPAGMGGEDPLGKHFFAPDFIMSHQQAIGLTDAQRLSLATTMLNAQAKTIQTQMRISAEVERMQSLIDASRVDEGAVLEQIDRVLAFEREIKREQISLMIRLKNLLTEQQQDALAKLRPGG
jgi:Spy/CpxP family protein refolding chaperone